MKRVFVAASTVAGAAALGYSTYVVGASQIRDALGRIGWGFAAILLLSGVRETVRAYAWTRTLDVPARLSLADALRARLAGEALNTLLPMGFVVGEPAKAHHVADHLPFDIAFSALMIELAFYSASLGLVFGAAALTILPPMAVLGIIVLGAAIVPVLKRARRIFEPLVDFVRDRPRRAFAIIALEAGYHALGIVEAYLILHFISPTGAAWTAALLLETVNRGVTIVFKMLPMRIGVDEASAAVMANRLALGSTTGVMLALVRKLRLLFWAALGLGFMLLSVGKQPARAYAPAT